MSREAGVPPCDPVKAEQHLSRDQRLCATHGGAIGATCLSALTVVGFGKGMRPTSSAHAKTPPGRSPRALAQAAQQSGRESPHLSPPASHAKSKRVAPPVPTAIRN